MRRISVMKLKHLGIFVGFMFVFQQSQGLHSVELYEKYMEASQYADINVKTKVGSIIYFNGINIKIGKEEYDIDLYGNVDHSSHWFVNYDDSNTRDEILPSVETSNIQTGENETSFNVRINSSKGLVNLICKANTDTRVDSKTGESKREVKNWSIAILDSKYDGKLVLDTDYAGTDNVSIKDLVILADKDRYINVGELEAKHFTVFSLEGINVGSIKSVQNINKLADSFNTNRNSSEVINLLSKYSQKDCYPGFYHILAGSIDVDNVNTIDINTYLLGTTKIGKLNSDKNVYVGRRPDYQIQLPKHKYDIGTLKAEKLCIDTPEINHVGGMTNISPFPGGVNLNIVDNQAYNNTFAMSAARCSPTLSNKSQDQKQIEKILTGNVENAQELETFKNIHADIGGNVLHLLSMERCLFKWTDYWATYVNNAKLTLTWLDSNNNENTYEVRYVVDRIKSPMDDCKLYFYGEDGTLLNKDVIVRILKRSLIEKINADTEYMSRKVYMGSGYYMPSEYGCFENRIKDNIKQSIDQYDALKKQEDEAVESCNESNDNPNYNFLAERANILQNREFQLKQEFENSFSFLGYDYLEELQEEFNNGKLNKKLSDKVKQLFEIYIGNITDYENRVFQERDQDLLSDDPSLNKRWHMVGDDGWYDEYMYIYPESLDVSKLADTE